jgi:hypothetical protein
VLRLKLSLCFESRLLVAGDGIPPVFFKNGREEATLFLKVLVEKEFNLLSFKRVARERGGTNAE